MAMNEGWGRRLRSARRAYTERHDRALTYKEIGERVGALVGRPAFSHSSVRAWFVDGQEPDSFEIAAAIARVLEVDFAALAIGADVTPEARTIPKPDPTKDRLLTDAEIERARRAVARKSEKAKPGGGRRRA